MSPSRLTDWEIVRDIQPTHPDWTIADHVAHLNRQGRDIDPIWVGRWLRNIAADNADEQKATPECAEPRAARRPQGPLFLAWPSSQHCQGDSPSEASHLPSAVPTGTANLGSHIGL